MLLSKIEQYWTGRAEGYSEVNRHELATGQDQVWFREIKKHLPEGRNLKILGVGEGLGSDRAGELRVHAHVPDLCGKM